MINANELRVFNWVQDDEGTQFQMKNIDSETAYPYNPIPLTPSILEKCGFENIQGDYWIKTNEILLALDDVWWWTNSWEADGEFGFDALTPYKEITSLHQLQNLYFALTGHEIAYKP